MQPVCGWIDNLFRAARNNERVDGCSDLLLLESGEASDGRSQSMFNEDVNIEKGDIALLLAVVGVEISVLIWPMPKVKAKLVHDVGGNGVAGAASFSKKIIISLMLCCLLHCQCWFQLYVPPFDSAMDSKNSDQSAYSYKESLCVCCCSFSLMHQLTDVYLQEVGLQQQCFCFSCKAVEN